VEFADGEREDGREASASSSGGSRSQHQPPALILWGRHDPYYALDEIIAYARELERVEIHVYDGAHLLLETHYHECADAIRNFVADVAR
jgi:pimeloyl-ACP methyl ester carboxylesterase